MKYVWETKGEPKLLEITVKSKVPQQVLLSFEDVDIPGTFYSKQQTEVSGKEVFEISLPLTPQKLFFEIRPVNELQMPFMEMVKSFNLSSLEFEVREKRFQTKWSCNERSPLLTEFIDFASWFAKNANRIAASRDYLHGDTFKLRYVPEIVDDQEFIMLPDSSVVKNPNFGQPIPTSFRIHVVTKEIQASEKYVHQYTVAQIMALLTHEFSHLWLNKDPDNEFEADYNSIMICRCMGFSKREIGDAYAQVFLRYYKQFPQARSENRLRMDRIMKTLSKIQ